MKKVIILFSILLLVLLAACTSSMNNTKHSDQLDQSITDSEKTKESAYVFVPDYTSGNANTRGNTVNMLQNSGRFTIQDKWIYYFYSKNIYKMPIGGGESDIILLYSIDEFESNKFEPYRKIQVMGDWIYFLQVKDGGWTINRIRTDGAVEEVIADNGIKNMYDGNDYYNNFIALGDWVYYVNDTEEQLDASTIVTSYHICRTKTDGTKTDILLSLEDSRPYIDFIDDENTLYYHNSESPEEYYFLNIEGGTPSLLFKRVKSADVGLGVESTVPFLFSLDKEGNLYFTGYDFFNIDDNLRFTSVTTYPIYYLKGPLSSLADGMIPTPLVNGPGVQRSQSIPQKFLISNDRLFTVSDCYDSDKYEYMKDFVYYDFSQQNMIKVNNDKPILFADLQDGYIYYCTHANGKWYRVMPDGSGWEDLTWMLEPVSPKKLEVDVNQN